MLFGTGLNGLNSVINAGLKRGDKRENVMARVNKIINSYHKLSRSAYANEINFLMSYQASGGRKMRTFRRAGRNYPDFDLLEKTKDSLIAVALIRKLPEADIDCVAFYYNLMVEYGFRKVVLLSLGTFTPYAREYAKGRHILLWDRAWLTELYLNAVGICADKRIAYQEKQAARAAAFDGALGIADILLGASRPRTRRPRSRAFSDDLWREEDNSLHGEEDPDMHPVDEDGYCPECDEYEEDMM